MSPALPSRRRAERFDDLVDLQLRGRSSHVSSGDLDALLDLVRQLRELPEVTPRPEFSADLRGRLMTEADTALATLDPAEARLRIPPRKTARDRRVATVLGSAALLGATTSMAVAAQSALPGDSLYPVKRAIEDARAGLADDGASRTERLLANASGRLDEAEALAVRGTDEGIATVPSTLEEFVVQAEDASAAVLEVYEQDGDERSISQLRDFTHASMEQLLVLEAQLPEDAHDELVAAARALTRIDDSAAGLCPGCGGAGISEVPRLLLSSAPDEVASVTVPTAEEPRRPARSPSDSRRPAQGPQVDLPDVDLDEGTSATGGGDTTRDGDDRSPLDAPTQDPVTELTATLDLKGLLGTGGTADKDGTSGTRKDGSGTRSGVTVDGSLDGLLGGVQDTTGGLLD